MKQMCFLSVSVLMFGAALASHATDLPGSGSPAAQPVKLATMGEASPEFAEETAQAFLKLLDLTIPEMAEVKTHADKADWTGALDAYRDLLINNLKRITHDKKLEPLHAHWNASGSEDLLEGYVLTGRHAGGVSVNYLGKPGQIDWFKIGVDFVQGQPEGVAKSVSDSSDRDFCVHLSSMHHFAPLAEAYYSGQISRRRQGPVGGQWTQLKEVRSPQPSGDIKYLKAWLGSWEDFARRQKAGYAEVNKAGKMKLYNSLAASQFQKLFASWRIEQFWGQFERVCQRVPDGKFGDISSVALAVILTEVINNHVAIVAKSIGGVPNQAAVAVSAVMETCSAMPGLKAGTAWEEAARSQVAQYYKTINMPDGTNTEQALNYNGGNPALLVNMMKLYPGKPEWIQELVPYAEQTLLYLTAMLRNGSHPGSWPRWGCDDHSLEELLRGYMAYLPNADVEKILARVFGPEDKGDPSFTSIQFPYSGYYVMRTGWRKDDPFCIFKSSRRPLGHARDDNNSFFLGAFGRDLLVDSGTSTYGEHAVNKYLDGTFSKNSIAVDGKSQLRTQIGQGNRGAITTSDAPIANRWHTSVAFDLAEGAYEAGYEDPAIEVRHERQIIFLREHSLWIVTDRLRGEMRPMPANETHTYTQAWNFDDEFGKDQVQLDEKTRRVWSDDPKGANVGIYNFSAAPLTYKKWFGEVLENGEHRGWVRGKGAEAKTPAVDVHATWTGKGEQILVTLIEARKDNQSRIAKVESIGKDGTQGFQATLDDKQVITYLAALDEAPLGADKIAMRGSALLTQTTPKGKTRGIALDCRDWKSGGENVQVRNFEFTRTKGQLTDIQEIRYPEGAQPRKPGLENYLVPEKDLSKGLVARWSFDNITGSTAQDGSGNGLDGTVSGTKLVDGVCGKALEFGPRGFMRIPHKELLNLTEGFTISTWVKLPADAPGFKSLAYKAGCYDFSLLRLTVTSPKGIGDVSANVVRDGKWHHVVAKWDKTDGWLRLYADRWELARKAFSNPLQTKESDLTISTRDPKSTNSSLQGCLDELRIYNRPLSDKEIWTLYYQCRK